MEARTSLEGHDKMLVVGSLGGEIMEFLFFFPPMHLSVSFFIFCILHFFPSISLDYFIVKKVIKQMWVTKIKEGMQGVEIGYIEALCKCNKDPYSRSYGFPSSHVWIWKLDCKEGWVPKKWCFWTVVLEKTLESLLNCKRIHAVHPKGNRSWIFIGRTEVQAETPILWPPDAKSWLIWRDARAGKDGRREEKWTTEDETVGWHHWLHALEFGKLQELVMWRWWWQGGLACCGPWGRKESDTTEWTDSHMIK